MVRDARRHPGIAPEERVHPVLVAGEDHDEVVALVLHDLEQDLDRLLPVVALVLGPVQVVGLVDEQHAAHRALQHLAGLRRRVADVLADEVVAGHRDEVALPHVAQAVQDLGHAHRDRRLAGARVAGEAHVQRRRLGGQADEPPAAVDEQERRDVADARLHRREADQVALELVEHVGHAGLARERVQVDRLRRADVSGRRGVGGHVHRRCRHRCRTPCPTPGVQ